MKRIVLVAAFFLLLISTPARAMEIQRVISPKGIEAWLVHDTTVPVIAMAFAFEGGSATDPADRQGLAALAAHTMDEGAGPYDSQDFQKHLRDNSISLAFRAGRDAFFGSVKTLTETKGKAVELLRLALTAPRFEDEAVTRIRTSLVTAIRDQEQDPEWLAGRTLTKTLFAGHPYSQQDRGTEKTLNTISRKDLHDFVAARLTRDHLKIAVSGDITAQELAPLLDQVFGNLSTAGKPVAVPDVKPATDGKVTLVEQPTTQTVIVAAQEGVKRSDPDWFPAAILEYILGGGGFSSRLTEQVREKNGLTYGISTDLAPMDHAALITVQTATANKTAAQVLQMIRTEWKRMADTALTAQELEKAKKYLTGAFPLQFDSVDDFAAVLLQIQRDNLGIDYLSRRDSLINAVTLQDAQRVAKRLFDPATLTVVAAGRPEGLKPDRILTPDQVRGTEAQ
ncbi:MAG: insulinase family protein [Pseudomonadota bacterium]|nr:insulinase family protein [Pseudomonadota bacterium]